MRKCNLLNQRAAALTRHFRGWWHGGETLLLLARSGTFVPPWQGNMNVNPAASFWSLTAGGRSTGRARAGAGADEGRSQGHRRVQAFLTRLRHSVGPERESAAPITPPPRVIAYTWTHRHHSADTCSNSTLDYRITTCINSSNAFTSF